MALQSHAANKTATAEDGRAGALPTRNPAMPRWRESPRSFYLPVALTNGRKRAADFKTNGRLIDKTQRGRWPNTGSVGLTGSPGAGRSPTARKG